MIKKILGWLVTLFFFGGVFVLIILGIWLFSAILYVFDTSCDNPGEISKLSPYVPFLAPFSLLVFLWNLPVVKKNAEKLMFLFEEIEKRIEKFLS